jgi:preprotein translocase subunit SecY
MIQQDSSAFLTVLLFLIFSILVVSGVCFFEQSYRKIPIHYAKKNVGNRAMSVQTTHLPLKVNMSGIMAAIFASTILAIPVTFTGFYQNSSLAVFFSDFMPGRWLYNVFFVVFGVFFSFFYASLVFKPDDIAENLKKQNAYIPKIRPGSETSYALNTVVTRLTLAGSFYMCLVVVLPSFVSGSFGQNFSMGGTSLLIVVGVALESIRQVSAHLASQRYDTLIFPSMTPSEKKIL